MNISMKEVKKHKKPHNAWVVIHNNVYDVSRFMDEHPGGTQPLLENAGKDGTRAFEDAGHSEDARQIMKKYKIGTLPSKEAVQYGSTIWHSSKKGETSRPRVEKSVTTIIVPIETRSSKSSLMKKSSGSATPPSIKKGQSSRVEKRVSTIIVPLEKGSGFPWKYLLLLAAAAGGAFAAYKYLNKAA